jgi:MinD-like ATPase involved in chromosome partitioning or flagellar assembly
VALVSFLSAKGSPGVTTTALLSAALWPRPAVVLDADPAGGDVAVRVPAADGGVLDPDRGLLPLLTSARRGLSGAQVLEQAQVAAGGTRVVCGLAGPEQSLAAGAGWAALAVAAAELRNASTPVDVLVDAGRVGADAVHLDLLRAADTVVLVVRADTASVLHARERLRVLGGVLRRADGLLPRTGVVVVGDPRRRDTDEVAAVLTTVGSWVEDFGRLPLDPAGARVFDGARTARPERTALVRAARAVVPTLAAAAHGELQRGAA